MLAPWLIHTRRTGKGHDSGDGPSRDSGWDDTSLNRTSFKGPVEKTIAHASDWGDRLVNRLRRQIPIPAATATSSSDDGSGAGTNSMASGELIFWVLFTNVALMVAPVVALYSPTAVKLDPESATKICPAPVR
jgi:hypothetical protein